jgi:hypothetical protein
LNGTEPKKGENVTVLVPSEFAVIVGLVAGCSIWRPRTYLSVMLDTPLGTLNVTEDRVGPKFVML